MDAAADLDLILNGSDDDFFSVEDLGSSEESLMSSSEEESMDEDQNASHNSSNDEGEYQTESSSDEEDSDDEDGGDDALRGRGRGHSLCRIFYSIARWKALFIHFQKIYGVWFAFPFRFRVFFNFLGLTILRTKLMEGKGLNPEG